MTEPAAGDVPGLDTSVAVRLLIGVPPAQAEAARALLADRTTRGEAPATVSDLVVGETYFALRHHYAVPHDAAVDALRALLDDPRVQPTGVARAVLGHLRATETAPGLMDRLIHGDYERSGMTFVTFDHAAARLPGARRLR